MARPVLLPLAQLIAKSQGHVDEKFPMPVPYSKPFTIEVFIAGRAKAKDRGTPRVGKGGGAYIFTSPDTKAKEDYIREEFLQTMHLVYPQFVQYLPIVSGWCHVKLYFLMPPPDKYYSGMPHTGPPDTDNLYKLVKDALSGRASGRPPLAFKDDAMSAGGRVWKCYWDPSLIDKPGYPGTPGTHVVIHYELTPRDPKFLAVGSEQCKVCGRDDFISLRARRLHENRCSK